MHSASLLLTHALSLCLLFLWFPALGPILTATVPRLAARPWPLLTKTELKGRLEFPKGRGKRRVCVCIWGISVRQTEKQESPLQFTTIPNPESILPRAFELCKGRALGWNLKPAALCFNRHVQWLMSTFLSHSFVFLSLIHILTLNIRTGLPEGEVQPRWSTCYWLKHATYSERG